MNSLQNLTFMVSLMDRVSGPAGGIMKTMDNVTTRIQSGYQKIGIGIAGVAGTGYALESAITPTKEMQAALGSLKSLGVADDVLSNLTNTALKFSLKYGESATDFVKSSYNIQSAISGLSGNELAAFTNASSILAKGTMADMGTITDYVGTMYSVFKESADGMGKSNWIEQLAGQTALAVNIFKTTGQGMSEAFSGLSGASSAPLAEQLAVLGQLQAVKHGSEAGTLYKSFLNGVGNSQKDLGLNFTDMNGKLLPMVDILTKITGKFGSLENQATRDVITKALGGTDAMALVDILSKDIVGLNHNIADIGKQTGMQNAIEMANAMTMPWDRAAQGTNALSISFGMRLMPEINAFFNSINGGIQTMLRWNTLFPELSRFLGIAALGVFGLIAGVSLLSLVMGVATLASGGLAAIFAIISSPIILLAAGIAYAIYKWDEWGGAIMYVGQAITDAFGITGILETFWSFLKGIYNGWSMIFTLIYDNAGSILSFIGDVFSAVGNVVDILGRALGFGPVLDWVEKLFKMIVDGWKMIGQMVLPSWMQTAIGIQVPDAPKSIAAPFGIAGNSSNNGGLMQKYAP
ncbi:MAG: phage tail tape measure protein [Methylococcaceae bacterium]|nr:phage tail tape measure protein [Methylococcaceae bacterium]MDP3021103.1 phage tail tape measure protein [Methylococcaceae bacterium]MDP3388490.1 phage tail tape measure protein [Methylococcaceae bacterium]MDP3931650.1 phage tail tape measure protein [Methylococcaceae bacterium]MDZ4157314.1 phage tail tape measure protein [Methylococcales bacterium]